MAVLRFAARDPGGANVLAALVPELPAAVTADAWTLPRAERLRRTLPADAMTFEDTPSASVLAEVWDRNPADVLLTGTSHYAPFEQALWQIAAARSVPTLAVLDQWMNIGPRFTAGRPDFVTVLDPQQRPELIAIGFRSDHILDMGHPWLAQLAATGSAAAHRPRSGARVLFASEPIRDDVAKGANAPFGFDEFDAFMLVRDAAAEVARRGSDVSLVAKCHPYEDARAFAARVESLQPVDRLTVLVSDGASPALEAVRDADLVTGISSMILIEAMVLGRAVISVQPHLSREETFVPSIRGAARTLTDPRGARTALAELIASDEARARERARHAPFVQAVAGRPGDVLRHWLAQVGVGIGRA